MLENSVDGMASLEQCLSPYNIVFKLLLTCASVLSESLMRVTVAFQRSHESHVKATADTSITELRALPPDRAAPLSINHMPKPCLHDRFLSRYALAPISSA